MNTRDRFAEALSRHCDDEGVAAGLAPKAFPGGDVKAVCLEIGIEPGYGHVILSKIRKQLGPQAR